MRAFATRRLTDRRIRLNHSTTSLAEALVTSAGTVRSIEGGADPKHYEIGFLDRYAATLGVTFDQLFDTGADPEPSDDVSAVVGLLVAAGGTVLVDSLCAALSWEPERTRDALDEAAGSLAKLGLRLAWDADVSVTVHADVSATPAIVDLSRHDIARSGLTREQARIVYTLATAGTRNRSDKIDTAVHLEDAGIVEFVKRPARNTRNGIRAAVRLTAQARRDLCLDD